jgi:hypothetical protein
MFEPDESKGTRGAGGAADIVNGIYRTRENADIKNGFYRITVYGYDPSLNTKNSMDAIMSIFTPYTTEFEVTTEKQTIDIDVPKNDGQSSPIKHNVTY